MSYSDKHAAGYRIDDSQAFNEREEFTDCAERRRSFDLTIRSVPGVGFTGHAHEVTSDEHGGYIFRASSEASLPLCLARLRGKVRAGLAQRYLIPDGDHLDLPLERLRGRIDPEGLVVDGRLLDWSSLHSLLQSYEGWDIELRIPLEDQ